LQYISKLQILKVMFHAHQYVMRDNLFTQHCYKQQFAMMSIAL